MRRKKEISDELLENVLSLVGIAAVALFLIVLFRLKGGILGVVLGTIAVAALIYWLMEIRKIFRERKPPSPQGYEWFYDLFEEGEHITLIARVPGPSKEVKIKIVDDMLVIRGGGDFVQRIQMPKGARLQNKSYVNGVLHVKLQRTTVPNNKMPSK